MQILRAAAALAMACSWWAPAQPAAAALPQQAAQTAAAEAPAPAPAAQVQARAEAASAVPVLRSSKGKEFWFAVQNIYRCTSAAQQFGVFVSSDEPGTGRLSATDNSFSATTFSVQPGVVTTVTVPRTGSSGVHPFAAPEGISSKSVYLTATTDVSVYLLNFCPYIADGSTAIPVQSAGKEYIVAGYIPAPNARSQMIVVAQEESTHITVTYQITTGALPVPDSPASIATLISTSVVNASPPISTAVLNAGQVYVFAQQNADFSGSLVQSDKPVIVYGHVSNAYVPNPVFSADQLLETMSPVSTWGRRYVAMATPNRRKGDTFRIYAAEDGTPVFSNGITLGTLDRMQWMEYRTASRETKLITSTKSIMVQLYMNGNDYDLASGDPSMLTIQPLEQGLSRYTFATPKDLPQPSGGDAEYTNTVNIVAPDAANLKVYLDGVQVPMIGGGGTGFVTATASISPGGHVMTGTLPFILSVAGLRKAESYAYPGGSTYVDLTRVGSLSIFPGQGDYSVQKGERCFIATVKDVDGVAVPGLPVYFNGPTGAILAGGNADENGQATVCYTGQDGDVGLNATAGLLSTQSDIRWHNTLQGNADVYDLQISPGQLSPAFVSNTTNYTANMPLTVSSVIVTPTLYMAGTYTITSAPGVCTPVNSPANCSLQSGLNTITVTAASENGAVKKYYVIQITREAPPPLSDADLFDLAIHPGTLAPAFVSDTLSYTAEVANAVSSVVVTPTLSDPNAAYTITGSPGTCTPAASPANCALNVGVNVITVTVTAEDGTTTKDYVVTITRAVSNDANLIDLTIHPGALAPAFVSSTTSYSASVPAGTTSAAVTATTSDANAAVAYASSAGACTPGNASPSDCAIAGPKTWITVTVTASDGATTQAYYIEITVAEPGASSDANLIDLTIDPGTLAPAFVSSTNAYAAGVPNGTTATDVTATPSDANATVTYESSAGACALSDARNAAAAPANCAVAGPKTWITVTVTAEDGATTEKYFIEITVAAPLTTIDRVWPGTGLPAGGMPVQIFGTGFVAVLTVTVGPYTDGLMSEVPFVPVNDGQIDFVMPAGVAGQRVSVTVATAGEAQTVPDAFTYVQPQMIEFDGLTGGVFTTTDGVVVEIPSQGVDGMFVITMTPLPPAPGVPGNILMYSFRLDALLNWVPLASLTNPVTIKLPIDENIFALADGERPWLYSWTGAETTALGGQRSAVGGRWVLVRGQEYDPGTRLMTVGLKPMGVYALSTAYLRAYWFPVVPVLR